MPHLRSFVPQSTRALSVGEVQSWRNDAACIGVSEDIFFPASRSAQSYVKAKSFCRSCPVWRDCLDFALKAEGKLHPDNRFGMWGGMTEIQRFKLACPETADARLDKKREDARRYKERALRERQRRIEEYSKSTNDGNVAAEELPGS